LEREIGPQDNGKKSAKAKEHKSPCHEMESPEFNYINGVIDVHGIGHLIITPPPYPQCTVKEIIVI
jgi:hypothetical protein